MLVLTKKAELSPPLTMLAVPWFLMSCRKKFKCIHFLLVNYTYDVNWAYCNILVCQICFFTEIFGINFTIVLESFNDVYQEAIHRNYFHFSINCFQVTFWIGWHANYLTLSYVNVATQFWFKRLSKLETTVVLSALYIVMLPNLNSHFFYASMMSVFGK